MDGGFDEGDLLAALVAFVARPRNERPAGFFTAGEIAEKSGRTRDFVADRLRAGVRAGRVEQRNAVVDGRSTKVYRVTQ